MLRKEENPEFIIEMAEFALRCIALCTNCLSCASLAQIYLDNRNIDYKDKPALKAVKES